MTKTMVLEELQIQSELHLFTCLLFAVVFPAGQYSMLSAAGHWNWAPSISKDHETGSAGGNQNYLEWPRPAVEASELGTWQ